MNKLFALFAVIGLIVGCGGEAAKPKADPPAQAPESGAAGETGGSAAKEGSGEGSGAKEVRFNLDGLPTLAVSVPGIHCEACAASVDETLAGVAGVKDVKVCVTSKTATLAIDQAAFDAEAAVEALAEAEFEGAEVVVKTAEPAAEGDADPEAS